MTRDDDTIHISNLFIFISGALLISSLVSFLQQFVTEFMICNDSLMTTTKTGIKSWEGALFLLYRYFSF